MRSKFFFLIIPILWTATGANSAAAQAGGPYDLSHAVIAGGGGSESLGGTFKVDGTIGQNLAGARSTGGGYDLVGGFWFPPPLAPTAASVNVSGRIRTAEGRGITNVQVILTDTTTGERFETVSSLSGYYRFEEVAVGRTYLLSVSSKRYTFDPAIRLLILVDELTGEDFTALPT
jgi:hypothetical protein